MKRKKLYEILWLLPKNMSERERVKKIMKRAIGPGQPLIVVAGEYIMQKRLVHNSKLVKEQ